MTRIFPERDIFLNQISSLITRIWNIKIEFMDLLRIRNEFFSIKQRKR